MSNEMMKKHLMEMKHEELVDIHLRYMENLRDVTAERDIWRARAGDQEKTREDFLKAAAKNEAYELVLRMKILGHEQVVVKTEWNYE